MNKLITNPSVKNGFATEIFPENYEPKMPLVILLDVSHSMKGNGIDELNKGLRAFETMFLEDPVALARLDIAIVTFSTNVKVMREFSLLKKGSIPNLEAGGRTHMIEGIEKSIQLLNSRKNWYKNNGLQYYRPYILLITDGSPWPNNNVAEISKSIKEGVDKRSFVFQAFGAGNANMKVLNKISHSDFPPQKISGYNFMDFFKWLVPSISTLVSQPVKCLHQ